jgi:NADH:ubiquinone oxidoreductase subunit 2 (subunit N)
MLGASGLGSICFASVAALYQKRIKRLMAYSTVSHTGFLLLGICCSTVDSIKACTVYIVLYILMTLTLFSLLFLSGINNPQQKYLIN